MNPELFAKLRNVLASLITEKSTIRRVVDDTWLDSGRIDFDAAAINLWHAVLTEAEKHLRVDELLRVVEQEYPENQALSAACSAYRQSSNRSNRPAIDSSSPPLPSQRRIPMNWVVVGVVLVALIVGLSLFVPQSPFYLFPTSGDNAGGNARGNAGAADATKLPTDGMRVLDNVDDNSSGNAYYIETTDVESFAISDDLVVYGEPNPGTEVAIALLKVVGKNRNSLTAQAVLVDPQRAIRTNIDFIAQSQLVPAFDRADGYLLRAGRVRLRPDHQVSAGLLLQALQYERVDAMILDALPLDPAVTMRVTNMGTDGQVAAVELVDGSWPITGTIVAVVTAN